MIITGHVDRWAYCACRIMGTMESQCGKSLELCMGAISTAGEIHVVLPNIIPAYSFLSSVDAHCPGLSWEPPQLKIFIARFFSVVDKYHKCIGALLLATSDKNLRDRSTGESAEWWYATAVGRIHGNPACGASGARISHDLNLRKGWNAIRRRIDAAGKESCRTAPPSASCAWHFRPAEENRSRHRECTK